MCAREKKSEGEWEVKSALRSSSDVVFGLLTLGASDAFPPEYKFVIKNKSTGQQKSVVTTRARLGERIAAGEFDE